MSLDHNPALLPVGARLSGLKPSEILKVRETPGGGLVVINQTGAKFTYAIEDVERAQKSPRGAKVESLEEKDAREAAELQKKAKKPKNADGSK